VTMSPTRTTKRSSGTPAAASRRELMSSM
jgi:hypothetical protein